MVSAARDMRLERQIGQVFMVGFPGTEPDSEVTDLIQSHHVGGIILFSRNCRDVRQVSALTSRLQALARDAGHPYPLLVATDQENGLVRRLDNAITTFPGNMALGAAGSDSITLEVAQATGEELKALGINMNLAPVADVNSDPLNPVIGVRSFGEDAVQVARLTVAAVRGFRSAGIICSLKHFPGHGDTAVDSHRAIPSIPHTLERLEAIELVSFRSGITAGAETVMVAHLRLPHIVPDPDELASISPAVVRLLRESLGFDGVVITDCLEMDAIANTIGTEPGAVRALRAGMDLVLISHRSERQRGALAMVHAAAQTGELPEEMIRRAAERVMRLKERHLAWETLPAPLTQRTISIPGHQRLRDRVYERSTTLVRNDDALIPLRLATDARLLVVAQPPARVTAAVDVVYAHEALVESVRAHHASAKGIRLNHDANEHEIEDLVRAAAVSDLIIMATLNAHLDERQSGLMRRLLETGRPIIGIAVCNPYDLAAFPELRTFLATYEYTEPALSTVVGVIFGATQPRGRLPVSLPGSSSSV